MKHTCKYNGYYSSGAKHCIECERKRAEKASKYKAFETIAVDGDLYALRFFDAYTYVGYDIYASNGEHIGECPISIGAFRPSDWKPVIERLKARQHYVAHHTMD